MDESDGRTEIDAEWVMVGNLLTRTPAGIVAGARKGRLRDVTEVLNGIVTSLRAGQMPDAAYSEYLADALQDALEAGEPRAAAKALASSLGILRTKAGAKERGALQRRFAGRKVYRLVHERGVPLNDNKHGEGAVTRVARDGQFGLVDPANGRVRDIELTEAQVRRGYEDYREWRKKFTEIGDCQE